MKGSKLERAAYHEAGHIVATYLLDDNIDRFDYVTIEEEGDGYCHPSKANFKILKEKAEKNLELYQFQTVDGFKYIFNEFCISVAGGVSEMNAFNLKVLPKQAMVGDFQSLKKQVIYPFSFPIIPKNDGTFTSIAFKSMIDLSIEYMRCLLMMHLTEIKAIANYLIKYNCAEQWALYDILGDHKKSIKSKKKLKLRIDSHNFGG